MILKKTSLAALCLLAAEPASALTIYYNDFSTENQGVAAPDYTGFQGLHVVSGSVDLVNASSGIRCRSGACVDLAGTAGSYNKIATKVIHFSAGERITFKALLGGDQRDSRESFSLDVVFLNSGGYVAQIGSTINGISFSRPPAFWPLGSFGTGGYILSNTAPTTQSIFFEALEDGDAYFKIGTEPSSTYSPPLYIPSYSDDETGPILHRVSVQSASMVPESKTWLMMMVGFGLCGAMMRRGAKDGGWLSGALKEKRAL